MYGKPQDHLGSAGRVGERPVTLPDPFMVCGEQEPHMLPSYNQPRTAEQGGGGGEES